MRAGASEQSRRSWLSWLGLVAVLMLAAHAGRAALVAAEGERRPVLAQAVWPSHPLPQETLALASIGAAAREGKAPTAEALEQMRSAARANPLGLQPMLVAATERLATGDRVGGERLLKAALKRDPRSTAAHFLLADLYVRERRIGDALVHVGVLGRRVRGSGTQAFAGALAAYLRDTGAVAEVGPVLQQDPALRSGVMTSLAQDPSAGNALQALIKRGDAREEWFRLAFERNLAAGDIGQARSLLAAAGVAGGGSALTSWSAGNTGGPLSWRFPPGADGVAEPQAGGPLALVFYGRADTALAEHLLLLPPGRYRFQAQFAGQVTADTLEWRMTCVQGGRQPGSWPVSAPASTHLIDVPAGCLAQRLSLWGRMGEFPRTTSAELLKVSLDPVGGGQ